MKIVSRTAAEVKPERVRWAWAPRIPLGEPTILAGAPGIGKTQLAIRICAEATRGTLDGDLSGGVAVGYVSAEDSVSYTLTPRFLAAGGDPQLVHFFECKQHNGRNGDEERGSIELPADVPLLDQWVSDKQIRLLVFDPFVAMLPPALNAHRDQHVRRAIAPIARMCHKHNIVALLILHLNKSQEGDALSRLSGSIGIGAAARSVLLFAPSPDDPEGEAGNERVLAHAKSNLGRKARSVTYRIEPRTVEAQGAPIQTSIAVPRGEANVSAGDLLGNAVSSSEASAREEARQFLLVELANGPVPTKTLRARADDAGHNWRTVERAKAALGVRAHKEGSAWAWRLNTAPNTLSVGLDGVVGLDGGKTDKDDKSAGIEQPDGVPLNALTADCFEGLAA